MSAILGVIVPCRDEAAVIERRLRNLAGLAWPAVRPDGKRAPAHRLLVVDDGSRDDTARLAGRLLGELFPPDGPVQAEVVANALRPGKCGAVTTAVGRLGDGVDLVVLTDADVVCAPGALLALTRAFAEDERLALACGAQRFVGALAADGTSRGPDGAALRPADDFYDRWSSVVRALESRTGRLFSVHGQLLAWRASHGLLPRPGLAADDLDLMLQVRSSGGAVRRIADAVFLEVKTPPGPAARSQGLRRARAYFEVLAGRQAPGSGGLDRVQWWLYAHVPRSAPELAAGGMLVLLALVGWTWGVTAVLAVLALLLLALALPGPRRALELLGWIRRARRASASAGGAADADRWEMQRT